MTSYATTSTVVRKIARLRVPLGFAAGAFVWWLARPTIRSLVGGAVIAVCGLALRVWAAGHLDKAREVTKSGPYRWMSHPLYVGSGILGVGLAVASKDWKVSAIVLTYLVVTIGAAIRHEEATLRTLFGPEYDAYRSGCAIDDRRFSWSQVGVNREYRAIVGTLVAFGLLVLR
jgi:protein-S-isoprenylcysteine O-methyltransferase Ste14